MHLAPVPYMIDLLTKFQDSDSKTVRKVSNTKLPVFRTQMDGWTHTHTDR